MTGEPQATLIDTSTIIELGLHDPHALPVVDRIGAAAIEALVLFENVYLDGRTVNSELPDFRWMDELDDGIRFVNNTRDEVQATYSRGMVLAEHVVRSTETARLLSSYGTDSAVFRAAGISQRYSARNTVLWSDIHGYVAHGISAEVADFIDSLLGELRLDRPGGAIVLARLCYYLALQEHLGSLLLLHPDKAYGPDRIAYGHAGTILDLFDSRIQAAYLKRRRDWLGEPDRAVNVPLLARYVVGEASNRGWSLGRTISWLRVQPEVRHFRQGIGELLTRIESDDHVQVDAILSDLERASEAWTKHLGMKPSTRKLSLQVAVPILSPSFDVPVPGLPKTPGRKLLVLVDKLLRQAVI